MRHAYEQMALHPESRKYVTINTHRGLFTYERLPYGVSSAPGIFQRVMDNLVKGIPHTMVYLDDILVTGSTEEEHLSSLDQVFTRLEQAGFRLKKSKCSFMASEVQYLGHKIDTQGIHAFGDTLKAVQDAPAPTNVTELRSYLGMVNHYGRFLPDLATVLATMHQLLKKDAKWKWGQPQQESSNCTRQMLCSPEVVVHYSTNKPLVLICDASLYSVGAVLAHRMEDGSERPIVYHSRSLSDSEKNYAQIDREALAIILGLTKFNQYIWGRLVTIVTDHKPLLGLLGPNKPVPQMISPRMQRWALKLSGFEYDLVYRPGPSIPEAEALSRLPPGPAPINMPVPGDTIHIMQHMDMSPVASADVRKETARDPVLSQVYLWVQSG